MTAIDTLLAALTSGAATIIDLTAPLSETTPILQLPQPFANTQRSALEELRATTTRTRLVVEQHPHR